MRDRIIVRKLGATRDSTQRAILESIRLFIQEKNLINASSAINHLLRYTNRSNFRNILCTVNDNLYLIQSTNLRLHVRTHQLLDQGDKSTTQRVRKPEAVYSCDFCPMTFSRIRHFNAHRATHTGERTTLPCTICLQEFFDINELKEHKRSEHPGTVNHPF